MKSLHSLILLSISVGSTIAFAPPAKPLVKATTTSTSSSVLQSTSPSSTAEEEITIDNYSRCLSPTEEKQSIRKESRLYKITDELPSWQYHLLKPIRALGRVGKKAGRKLGKAVGVKQDEVTKPGSLILLRCGNSEWSKTGRFTGWADPDLVREGVLEIEHAGR